VFDCSQSTFENKELFHKSDYLRKALQRKTDRTMREICDMLPYVCWNTAGVTVKSK